MGYNRHHAIIVTDCLYSDVDKKRLEGLHNKAIRLFTYDGHCFVSPVVTSPVNGYNSFFVAPDGSKEWWNTSDRFDAARSEFVAWLKALDPLEAPDWVVVQYGDDEHQALVVDDSDKECREE